MSSLSFLLVGVKPILVQLVYMLVRCKKVRRLSNVEPA